MNGWINVEGFIEVRREQQHLKTIIRQKEKFKRLLDREHMREGAITQHCMVAMMETIATSPGITMQ